MRGADDVSLGMSGPADTLLLSARLGDPTLLSEQGKAIRQLASSLSNIAQDALEGCVYIPTLILASLSLSLSL